MVSYFFELNKLSHDYENKIRTNPLTLAWNLFKWNLNRGQPPGAEWAAIGVDYTSNSSECTGTKGRWLPPPACTLTQRIYGFKRYMGMKRAAAAAARARRGCEDALVGDLEAVHALLLRPPPLMRSTSVLRTVRSLDGRLAEVEPDQLVGRLHSVKKDLQAAIESNTEQIWEERRTQVCILAGILFFSSSIG